MYSQTFINIFFISFFRRVKLNPFLRSFVHSLLSEVKSFPVSFVSSFIPFFRRVKLNSFLSFQFFPSFDAGTMTAPTTRT